MRGTDVFPEWSHGVKRGGFYNGFSYDAQASATNEISTPIRLADFVFAGGSRPGRYRPSVIGYSQRFDLAVPMLVLWSRVTQSRRENTIEPPQQDSADSRLHRQYALALGYAGATFVPAVLAVAVVFPELAAPARRVSVLYAAAILAFLGGIQWGFSLRNATPHVALRRLAISMVPPLWSAMALSVPLNPATMLLILGLSILLVYEWLERADRTYPEWYLPLRLRLTVALTASLALTLLL
jgi:hypothetical protein